MPPFDDRPYSDAPTAMRSPLTRYGSAVACVALATLATMFLADIHTHNPFLFFFVAVMASIVYGGHRAGLLAIALSTVALLAWVLPVDGVLAIPPWRVVQIVAFVLTTTAIAFLIDTLRRTHARLYAERESLQTTLASIGDGVIATDLEGRVTWLNSVASELSGRPAGEALGMPIEAMLEIVSADTHKSLENPVRAALASNRVVASNEPTLLCSAAGEHRVDSTASPIRNRRNELLGAVLVLRDLTERQQVEQRLRASEKRFRVAQELSLDAFAILDPVRDAAGAIVDFSCQYVNPKAAAILQSSRETLEGKRLLEVLPGTRSHSDLFERFVRVFETGQPHDVEVYYDADGLQGWFRNMAVKLDGEIAVSFSDVTERKQYEAEFGYQAFLLDNVSDAVFAVDIDLRITRWNRGAEELYGWKTEEAVGRPSAEVVQSLASPEERATRIAAVDAGRRRHFEAVHRNRAGEVIYVDSVATALRSSAGRIVGYVIINRDMTERKRHEEELVQLNAALEERVRERTAELERSNRELDQFAYIASHDLKAPLRGIALLASWLTTDASAVLPPASLEHLAKLNNRIRRMEKLLDDLLAYSRAGRVQHTFEIVDLRQLIQNAADLLNLPPTFMLHVEEPMPVIFAERVPLEMIFRNLIDNAQKHHEQPEQGRVVISAQECGSMIYFTVSDNGPGIATEYHDRVFDIFQKLKPRDVVEGSGMGLSVVKKTIESRGGTIRLESTPGAGTTFCFSWPLQQPGLA